jgi:GNAT superfamily N-acetyltransferase
MPSINVVESNNQFISFGRFLADSTPESEITEKDGITICWTGNQLLFFNLLFLSEQTASHDVLAQRLRSAAEYMRAKSQAGLFSICEDYLDHEARAQLDEEIEKAGLTPLMAATGMQGDLLTFDEAGEHSDLRIERATELEAIHHCADINSAAYGVPLDPMREGLLGAALQTERMFCYVGYDEGKPVSTASVILSGDILYVAFVATLPEARRRGFAEATMRHALQAAHKASGYRRTCLHSSEAGYAIYERMGYSPVTRIVCYGLAGGEDVHPVE